MSALDIGTWPETISTERLTLRPMDDIRSVAMLHRLGFVEREKFMEHGDEQSLPTGALGQSTGQDH